MKGIFCMLFFTLMTSGIFALGIAEEKNAARSQPLVIGETNETVSPIIADEGTAVLEEAKTIITGRIAVFGNEPHTFLGIVDENGKEYAVYSPDYEAELKKLQGQKIEFTVDILNEIKVYGSLFLKGGTVKPVSWKILE